MLVDGIVTTFWKIDYKSAAIGNYRNTRRATEWTNTDNLKKNYGHNGLLIIFSTILSLLIILVAKHFVYDS